MHAQLGSAFQLLIHLHPIRECRSIQSINLVKEVSGTLKIIPAITISADSKINFEEGFEEFEQLL